MYLDKICFTGYNGLHTKRMIVERRIGVARNKYPEETVQKILDASLKLFFSMLYQYILSKFNLKKLIQKRYNYKSLSEADYIIVCGGGFLGGKKFDSFIHLFQIYIDTLFGKKVIVMGTSIEPISNNLIKHITEKILKKIDFIFAREEITYRYLKNFMPLDKIDLIPDFAFMLNDDKSEAKEILEYKKGFPITYGITVRNWNFPNEKNSQEKMLNYKNVLAKFIDYMAKEYNAAFIFIPQVIVSYGNDVDVAKEIKKQIHYQEHFLILEDDFSPEEIKNLIWHCDFFIGTRMHSNIFALSMNVPTIAIAYEKKTNGIMHTVKMDNYILDINTISLDNLINMNKKLSEEKQEIRELLKYEIAFIRNEIQIKTKKVLKELEL